MAWGRKKETNWNKLKNRNTEDMTQYRDVYEDQQLDRSRLEEKQSMLSRNIGTAIVTLLVIAAVYVLMSFGGYGLDAMNSVISKSKLSTEEVYAPEVQAYVDEWQNGNRYNPWVSNITKEKKPNSEYKEELAALIETYPSIVYYFNADGEEITLEEYEAIGFIDPNYMKPTLLKIGVALFFGLLVASIMYQYLKRNLEAQNLMSDTSDINQYQNDQHVALPEELHRKFDWFPDVGAKASPAVSSMISHVAVSNKGIKKVEVAKRAEKDMFDEDGAIMYYKGEILLDEDGNPITEQVPFFDTDFMHALFDASKLPNDKKMRKFIDTTNIEYLPNDKRERIGKYETIAEAINGDWELPLYEPQRPGGAYLVDTAPVNTMVLAITRAGKGQTVIEPTLDMWLREKNPHNMVVNDPKGELLVKHYVRATVRGFEVVQFNLINAMKTDIYNPLGMAAEAARDGDFTKCAQYVENIADVFFPLDGGDDPVWPNAANNAFKRAAYGLIDYYIEEEAELRLRAERTNMDASILESQIDALWGKVTLYNCYQLFVQLTSKKMPNPLADFLRKEKAGAFANMDEEEVADLKYEAAIKGSIWEDKPEADCLTLYFTATEMLPKNGMRNLVMNANNALKSMAGAEKMMASVYGIAITAMSFFTDPTIASLTSGTPSQNVDLGGLSFPRRMGVRFHSSYMTKYHFAGMQARWKAYHDKEFTQEMGKDFEHEDLVTRVGWARYFFKGKFPTDTAYIKLEIVNPQSDMLMRTFYFRFKKAYQKSLDGKRYVKDPIIGDKLAKNGTLVEMRPFKSPDGDGFIYKKAKTTFTQDKIKDMDSAVGKEKVETPAILVMSVRYSEKPKMVFLVTPPHLMKYAKLILILVKQLVDLNFEQSYMTKSSQKPLYKTRFMLDELGNLQSEGHGISGLQTMLSIGLGQEQQFTLILQTLQQLRDVYGDSADKIIQGNTSNIVFLKSTDDSMLDTLQKMSGITHKAVIDSKTITRDTEKIFMKNEGKTSYTMSTREMPVITYNDMAFIPERNSIIFRAGDSPIWNRNETILPMSFRLFQNTITQPGKDYSLQTIPTLSSSLDFDVRKNQPDFMKMLAKRMEQAYASQSSQEAYAKGYELNEYQISQLDPDDYSSEVMSLVNAYIRKQAGIEDELDEGDDEYIDEDEALRAHYEEQQAALMENVEENKEQEEANQLYAQQAAVNRVKIYAGKMIAREDLVRGNMVLHNLDKQLIEAYLDVKGDMQRDTNTFTVRGGDLLGVDGTEYIVKESESESLARLNNAIEDEEERVFGESAIDESEIRSFGSYIVKDAFLRFLAACGSWDFAKGRFEEQMARKLRDNA